MKEVSCKALVALFQGLAKHHLPPETLCRDVPYSLQHLRNKNERIEWDVYCTIMSTVRPLWTDEEFLQLGYDFVRSRAFGSMTAIVRLLFSSREMYHWFNRMQDGAHPQIFTCFESKSEDAGPNLIRATIDVSRGYQHCREFFLMTKGGFSAGSTLAGLSPAKVDMREKERGAVYDILLPEGGGTLSWLRKKATWVVAARAAARELKGANESLFAQYAQLEQAQTRIQRQVTQLQTVFSISEVIRSNLDLNATIEAVARSLVEVASFAAAKVSVCLETDGKSLSRVTSKGNPGKERMLTKTLQARGRSIGEFSVWLKPETDLKEAEELLLQIAPSVAMEIDGALSFTLLSEYRKRDKMIQPEFSRQQIESQEAERKRLAAELHDGLGQDLLVINNELQQFMEQRTDHHEALEQIASLLQESIEGVREIASNLHPHHLDRLGFSAAGEAMTENISRSTGMTINTCCDTIDSVLPKETEIHMYRIIQEGLTNVVRHADAKNVSVRVKKNSRSIEITVSDDGKGFDQEEMSERLSNRGSGGGFRGFGLSSMTERARIIGGEIEIKSSPGEGTTVHVSFACP